MTSSSSGYGKTFAAITERAASAIVSRGHIRSGAAQSMLLRRLQADPGHEDSLLASPRFEAARIWKSADKSLSDLAGGILSDEVVNALDRAGEQALPRSTHPYVHQLLAWEAAAKNRSYMVTSGTGSGKTECFMVPMLDDLFRKSVKDGPLSGVNALILYPLNALIDSQKERLSAWISPFEGRISYAMYNRHTPESRLPNRKPGRAEVGDRKSLRSNPASVLVTNVTMLEYMLMRAQDRSILEKSKGKLRWIVLDEAHTYIGAQAAEMALLLRRVREAFGVNPEDVRLVATSATIGEGPETIEALRRFVADLGGVDPKQVDIILGEEEVLALPKPGADTGINAAALAGVEPEALWSQLAGHPRIQAARGAMRERGQSLDKLSHILLPDEANSKQRSKSAACILDAMAQARDPGTGQLLAPWRLHAFHRAQAGLWSCVDPACASRDPELAAEGSDWPFGQIHLFQRDHCSCGAPVFEIGACDDCGTPWLLASRRQGDVVRLTQGGRNEEEDDFVLDVEPDDEAGSDGPSEDVLIGPPIEGSHAVPLRLKDAVLRDGATNEEGHVIVRVTGRANRGCCARAGYKYVRVGPQRYGAPFLLGNAMPLLLGAMPQGPNPGSTPFGGRRLISFTDSRQGTARFAAKLQQEAERNLTRAAIYHAVQDGGHGDPAAVAKLKEEIVELEKANVPSLRGLIDKKTVELEALESGSAQVPWSDMLDRLAQNPELQKFAGDVWRGRPYGGNLMAEEPARLAEMFLLREMFRRPRLQNNAETMGLARLAFPAMAEAAKAHVPSALAEAGLGPDDWVDVLQAAIDIVFRNNLAVSFSSDPVDLRHWISPRERQTRSIYEPSVDASSIVGENQPRFWPTAKSDRSVLVQLIYRLTKGSSESSIDRDRVDAVLVAIFTALRQSKAIAQSGPSAWQLSFRSAAVERVDQAWLCANTRRLLPYGPGGVSINGIDTATPMARVAFPRLPVARASGLSPSEREEVRSWLKEDATIASLRSRGLWSDLHDRVAEFAPYFRVQEHSAQIDRESLKGYEDDFRAGNVNILNCSTTMEMGVDIPNVGVVVNTNVPPSPSNYRQRVGRAGRRGEPWALSFTFCKDMPLDWSVFRAPERVLEAIIPAPKVRLMVWTAPPERHRIVPCWCCFEPTVGRSNPHEDYNTRD